MPQMKEDSMVTRSFLVIVFSLSIWSAPAYSGVDTTLPSNGKLYQIVFPNGGEVFHVGDTMRIEWHAVDSEHYVSNHASVLEISFDDGISYRYFQRYTTIAFSPSLPGKGK